VDVKTGPLVHHPDVLVRLLSEGGSLLRLGICLGVASATLMLASPALRQELRGLLERAAGDPPRWGWILGHLATFALFRMYDKWWRYVGQRDVVAILQAVVLATVLAPGYNAIFHPVVNPSKIGEVALTIPTGVLGTFFLLTLVFTLGSFRDVRAQVRTITGTVFAAASAVMLAIPGPTVLLVISYALGQGWRTAFPIAVGVALGDFTAMTLSMLGVGALLATSATIFTILKWIGAAYLIYLGIKLFRAGGSLNAEPRMPVHPRLKARSGR